MADLDAVREEPRDDAGDEGGKRRKPSQATQLVELAQDLYWFGQSSEGPFGVPHDGPFVARMLRGGKDSLRAELAAAYIAEHGRAPSSSALADAMLVLEGRAQQSDRYELGLRVVRDRETNRIVIDLGDESGRAVVIEPGSWNVVDRAPVLFRRTELTGELPTPSRDGDLDRLHDFMNVDRDSWPVLKGWLVAALMADLPHPIVALLGEQGTAKTTTGKMLIRVFDPSGVELRTTPRDVESWAVAASGSWAVGLDNVSTIPAWLSDAMCRAVTGDGLVRRRLYTDAALSVLAFRRVLLMTSIDPGALRGDLADRLLVVDLAEITEEDRRQDEELETDFRATHPAIFGGLLDLTAEVLAVLPDVNLDRLPRMADFARVLQAVDDVEATSALGTYLGQADRLAEDVIDSDRLAATLRDYVNDQKSITGSAGELLETFTAQLPNPDRPPRGWPTSGQGMAGALKRCAPALRKVGIDVVYDRDSRPRTWTLTRGDAQTGDASDEVTETGSDQQERAVTLPVTLHGTRTSDGTSDGNSDPGNGQLEGSSGQSVTPVTPVTSERPPSDDVCIDCGSPTHRWCGGAA